MSDFWVFGYGSLMWRPGFDFRERLPARLSGAHRALCVYSWVHRGTEAVPGLVLGLDRGGSCRGVAFRIAAAKRTTVIDYLRERELVTDVYREVWRSVAVGNDLRPVKALTYVVDRNHRQYAGALAPDEVLAYVRRGRGRSGDNTEYVLNTAGHLRQIGIRDPLFEWLANELDPKAASADSR
jgi:glutathione-specific gamma-glutamylcyclotransferase